MEGERSLDSAAVLEETMERLTTLHLPVPVEIDAECRSIVEAIIHQAADELSATLTSPTAPGPFLSYSVQNEHVEFGELQSERRGHPAESLVVADVLFDVALPEFVAWGAGLGCDPVDVVRVLHHVIWRRFPAGAIGYTEGLRQRLFEADRESRLGVSRNLHDRVAHGVAAGIQRIELGIAETGGSAHLKDALSILRSSLDEVRAIATDLRRHVGDRTLEQSLLSLADESRADSTPVRVRSSGRRMALSAATEEEAYLIALEAIRNGREHARASCIDVAISWNERELTMSIEDDGIGYDPERASPQRGLGLHVMRERALNLGGIVSVVSVAGRGTTVRLVVPHAGVEA
jgi:Signal transduction histidine kinase